ncbi:uncharacterized protein At5g08430-like [Chenopodium quinoa]|uniref:uncharacterized protein At5g08430-like n=1 Tax=Chenopodium quinoa TaxID=63459 RepID=UPI000B789A68|nr:uncharacterized protein At5g08430-like [Chenopodium quinoa]
MVKRKRNNNISKPKKEIVEEPIKGGEVESEDYCFVCKDGGLLMVCDYKGCVKSYHAECVGKEESTEDTDDPWICGWHNCLVCKRNSKYQCFCCPNAVCQSCFKDAAFAKTVGGKGFCNDCLKLALLGEEGVDVDSDGEKVDFKDRETYEGLFKEYWDIVKEKEGLTLEDLHDADVQIKKDDDRDKPHKSHKSRQLHHSDSDESVKEEENKELISDDDHDSDGGDDGDSAVQPVIISNKKKPKQLPRRRKGPKRIEFVGWASKVLIAFLESIGVDTSKKLSQDDVASLINKYVHENKLFDPDKKKKVLCDVRLRPLIGRKSFSIYKINDALEGHFSENLDKSEGEGYSSGCEEEKASLPIKKNWWRKLGSFQHKGSLMEKFQQKEAVLEEPKKPIVVSKVIYSQFATISPQNMKLVYLKRCLVEKLLEQRETFESKVVGSFVKVKSEPFDARLPYQLLPVKGISNSGEKNNGKFFLQVSNLANDVPIRLLSNDDIAEEDCEGLRQKVDNGLLPKPTVVELEKKAKEIHEDITKYWITRELSILKNRIDQANEKGRRHELYESRQRRDLLQSEAEQSRLLNEVPKVIADVIKPDEETQGDDNSGNANTQVIPGENSGGNGNISA